MTDFLSRLIGRAQGNVPVLHRRRPSLFEAIPESSQLLGGRRGAPEPSPDSVVGGEVPKAMGPTRPRVAPSPAQEVVPDQRTIGSVVPRITGPAPRTPAIATPANTLAPRTVPPRETEEPRIAEEKIRKARSSSRRGRSDEAPLEVESDAGPVLHPGSRRVSRPTERTTLPSKPEGAASVATPFGVPLHPLLVSPARTVMRPVSAALGLPAPTTPVPTIQVTIGRIEVRAVSPESHPQRGAATSAPRLSLEDYLRARGGGKK